jgi:hypothetical protein
VKFRTALEFAEEMLQQLHLEKGEKWVYDPFNVISTRRPSYKHQPNPLLERISNLDSWEETKEIWKSIPKIKHLHHIKT